MATLSFASAVSAWVAQTKERMTAVARESAEDVIEEMQRPVGAGGNLPVQTGFLRASLRVTRSAPAMRDAAVKSDGTRVAAPDDYSLAVTGWELGTPLYASYVASYAAHVNFGTATMQPRQFVGHAAMKWPSIVAANCEKLREQVDG